MFSTYSPPLTGWSCTDKVDLSVSLKHKSTAFRWIVYDITAILQLVKLLGLGRRISVKKKKKKKIGKKGKKGKKRRRKKGSSIYRSVGFM